MISRWRVMLATGNTTTMATDHEKVAGLAERLEFSNALVKQLRRELSTEKVEHGKTKAALHELEHEIASMRKNDATLAKLIHLESVLKKRNEQIIKLERLRDSLLIRLNQPKEP